ncbi:hypothetical protein SAMN04488005_2842 [Yoonia tamlensis]|uniref:DUF2125 domain-containing protein n=1 Tax=Yoonia tamlensis TaxID=390270 RepID=A0A1I6HLW2_9RHOB|nr:hypothetical protein [Yoonia tamlensis]SFR55459.1 hypothetical protein SAMN04488005_2842 [Yoonia tamlensis]
MTRRYSLPAILAVIGAPAIADITADDVWASQSALLDVLGISLDADISRTDNFVFYENVAVSYAFPMYFGTFRMAAPPMTMVEETDGTVTIITPKTMDYDAVADFDGSLGVVMTLDITVQAEAFQTTASGTPKQITYTQSSGPTEIFASIRTQDVMYDVSSEMTFDMSSEGFTATTTVSDGAQFEIRNSTASLPSHLVFDDEGFDGVSSQSEDHFGAEDVQFSMTIPKIGLDALNLTAALRAGLATQIIYQSASLSTKETTFFNGRPSYEFEVTRGAAESRLDLSQDGISIGITVDDADVLILDAFTSDWGGKFAFDRATVDVQAPVLASDAPQTAAVRLNGNNITIADETWARLNPEMTIARDPMNIAIDLTAGVSSPIEWLDFLNVEDALMIQQNPVALHELQLNSFDISGAGAAIAATGAFTFDMADLDTFDGIPRPTGAAGATMSGVHELLDTLIAMDLLDADEAFGMRMAVGMFSRDDGNGTLTTAVEIDETGSVHVNGERIR